jgi:hypothetical protein
MIALALEITGATLAALDTNRQALESYFKPGGWTTSLKFTMASGVIRYIDGAATTMGGAIYEARQGFNQTIVVGFRCADPTFYDPVEYTWTSGLGSTWSGGLAIPLVVPISIAMDGYSASLTYGGSWQTYPRMRLYGPITNWKVANDSTGEVLDGAGDTIAAGSYYDIDCRYGHKTILDSGGVSRVSTLTTDSDLGTFHIAASPEVPSGVNALSVHGTGLTAATYLVVYYIVRYIGI